MKAYRYKHQQEIVGYYNGIEFSHNRQYENGIVFAENKDDAIKKVLEEHSFKGKVVELKETCVFPLKIYEV